ncbi:MAG TPA: hypothetical protein VGD89_09780 [Flavipsychrobacter sp.]
MKPQILLLLLIVYTTGFSQPLYNSYAFSNTVNYSITLAEINNYYYLNTQYQRQTISEYQFLSNALQKKQAMYDTHLDAIGNEYRKLKKLELININNRNMIEGLKQEILYNVENKGSKVDFSDNRAFNEWMNYITQVYDYPSVCSEIKFLQAVNKIITRLKSDFPYAYHEHRRYKELLTALKELENCEIHEINQLYIKYGLL